MTFRAGRGSVVPLRRKPTATTEAPDSPGQKNDRSTVLSAAGMVAGNGIVVTAVTIYMGWAYSEAFFGYFGLSPLDLGLSPVEYGLRGAGLVRQNLLLVLALVLVIAVVIERAEHPARRARSSDRTGRQPAWPKRPWPTRIKATAADTLATVGGWVARARGGVLEHAIGSGAFLLAAALGVGVLGDATLTRTYVTLGLVIAGVLLLTAPGESGKHLRVRPLAVVIAFGCSVWAVGLYASAAGTARAQHLAHNLAGRTSVTVYSTTELASFDRCKAPRQKLRDGPFRYAYPGMREIAQRSGTDYLVPPHWTFGRCVLPLTISGNNGIQISRASP